MVCKQLLYVSLEGMDIKNPAKKAIFAGSSFYTGFALSSVVSGRAGSGYSFPS
jgi:hypothetical protein